jgi:hypothetical protein
MKTYVAVIGGEALLAFRAEDDEQAQAIADDDEGDVRSALLEVVRVEGTPLWDGSSRIAVRAATEAEHTVWETETDVDDDADIFEVFLIPVYDPAGADEEDPSAA